MSASGDHSVINERLESDRAKWEALQSSEPSAAAGVVADIVLIDDHDDTSRVEDTAADGTAVTLWGSHLKIGRISRTADGKYTLTSTASATFHTDKSDAKAGRAFGSDSGARGAEFSALEVFNGQMLTFCDRTGKVFVIEADVTKTAEGWEPGKTSCASMTEPGGSDDLVVKGGDGAAKNKPFKTEWSTQKGGTMVVGSTGKERTYDGVADGVDHGGRGHAAQDGPEKIDEDQLWVKIVASDFSVTHVDARPHYDLLRNAAACPLPGWITHESCRWSETHSMWFWLPRKMCRDPYNPETATFTTLIMAVGEKTGTGAFGDWDSNPDGDGVLIQEAPLPKMPLRGVSDFVFVPGTGDTHLFVLRTEEWPDGKMETFASIIDLLGNVLMEEHLVEADRKYEGSCILAPDVIGGLWAGSVGNDVDPTADTEAEEAPAGCFSCLFGGGKPVAEDSSG